MQVGDILKTPKGNHLRVVSITEDDDVITHHMEFNVDLPPVPRYTLESQTVNISAHCWDKTFVDLEAEIFCTHPSDRGAA